MRAGDRNVRRVLVESEAEAVHAEAADVVGDAFAKVD